MTRACQAPGCRNAYFIRVPECERYVNKKLFTFPKDKVLRNKWIEASGCTNITNNSYLCEDNFDQKSYGKYGNRDLYRGAVPKYFQPNDDTSTVQSDIATPPNPPTRRQLVSQPGSSQAPCDEEPRIVGASDISGVSGSVAKNLLLHDIPGPSTDPSDATISSSPISSKRRFSSTKHRRGRNILSGVICSADQITSPISSTLSILPSVQRRAKNTLPRGICSTPRKKQLYIKYRKQWSTALRYRAMVKARSSQFNSTRKVARSQLFQHLYNTMSESTANYLSSIISNQSRKPTGRQWTTNDSLISSSV